MHDSVLAYVARVVAARRLAGLDVLEVGSLDINGSVRPLFDPPGGVGGRYIGVDLVDGPGVDEVVDARNVGRRWPASFDVVVSTEALEHDPAPWETMKAIGKALRPGGTLIVTARGNGFPPHNPPDHWRFLPSAVPLLFDLAGCDVVEAQADPQVSGCFAVGVRRPNRTGGKVDADSAPTVSEG